MSFFGSCFCCGWFQGKPKGKPPFSRLIPRGSLDGKRRCLSIGVGARGSMVASLGNSFHLFGIPEVKQTVEDKMF